MFRREPKPEVIARQFRYAYVAMRKHLTQDEIAEMVMEAEASYRFVHELGQLPGSQS